MEKGQTHNIQKSWDRMGHGCSDRDVPPPAIQNLVQLILSISTEEAGLLYTAEPGAWFSWFLKEVFVGEQSQAAVIHKEEAVLDGFRTQWSDCSLLDTQTRTRARLCHFHGSESLESLTWLHSCQQHAFTQDSLFSPIETTVVFIM